jgi:hypothetical protein
MKFVSVNLGNRRDVKQQRAQVAEIAKFGASVIVGVEAVASWEEIAPAGWHGHQMTRDNGEPSGEFIIWAPTVQVQRAGGRYACGPDPAGLSQRFHPWVDVQVRGVGRAIRVFAVHRAPRRDGLNDRWWPESDRRLRRLMLRAVVAAVHRLPMGDWNERLFNDPAHLHGWLGHVWQGGRIDAAAPSRGLTRYVTRLEVVSDKRADDHDVIYLTIMNSKETR